MSALAATTHRIRLGQMCTCMGYRNPMYLAKVAATVDVISGGRVEMGIGAGWYEHEWTAYGYGFPSAGDRLAMLEDGVEIMRQAWREGVAHYAGEHYQVDGALCYPKPLQPSGIPLWIAGGGEKRTLRIAAKRAAYTNFDGTPEAFARKSEILAEHCRDLGRDFGEIVRSANFNVVIANTQREIDDRFAWLEDRYKPYLAPDGVARAVNNFRTGLVGTPEQIVEQLQARQKLGLAYAITYFAEAATDSNGIELFTNEVIPALTAK
jgi:alkanesulfonate monooxygenase SsuD/methylene tetrahydromethanopterin reductase-like flavin-dependent oxidoreductase (luciferase family)